MVGLDAFVYSFGSGAYKYSVNANAWTAISPPPGGTLDAAGAVTDGQYIYLLNGYNGGPVARLQRYDPNTDSYTTLAVPPTATSGQAAVYLNGKIYRIAGQASGGYTGSVDVYTISTATWTPSGTVAAYPQALSDLLAVTANSYIYAGGGGGSILATLTNKTYRYDPVTNMWDDGAVTDFRQAHYAGAGGILNGRWIVAGGYDVAYQIDKNVEALDLSQPTGSWIGLPWMPAWRFITSGATAAGVFYQVGGFSVGTSAHAEVQYYTDGPCYGTPQPATPTVTPTSTSTPLPCGTSAWSNGAPYTIPVAGAAGAAYQGVLYSFGGYANEAGVANAYYLPPALHTWLPIEPLPEARFLAGAVSDGTYLYILNGSDVTTLNSNAGLYRYEPATGTYTTLAVPPAATAGQAIVLLNGKIYRIAGHYSHYFASAPGRSFAARQDQPLPSDSEVNTVDVYTISTNSWAPVGTVANYPLFTSNLNAVAYNGYIYTEGGGGNGSAITDKTYRYDPTTNTWDDAAVPDLPTPLTRSAVDVSNGRWIVAGGYTGSGGPSSSVLTLDLANPTGWTMLAPLPIAEDYTSGARSGNDFYVVGGFNINVNALGANTVVQRYTDAPACPTSPTATATDTASPTSSATSTRTALPTSTALPATATPVPPSSTATVTPLTTATPCTVHFTDVTDPTAYYYQGVYSLACRGVISGYSDGTFRPFNNTTRGQMTKIVILAFNIPLVTPPARDTFVDVDADN
ncbi:MAG: S-layer homology domain-containing protein, partial [Chloroflexota bacterium]|nr:S-layer homology domain-containing protein [Chloroflexota bacterium]